jgi:hypothetical protein
MSGSYSRGCGGAAKERSIEPRFEVRFWPRRGTIGGVSDSLAGSCRSGGQGGGDGPARCRLLMAGHDGRLRHDAARTGTMPGRPAMEGGGRDGQRDVQAAATEAAGSTGAVKHRAKRPPSGRSG